MSTRSEVKKAKLEHPANHYKSPDEITKDTDLSEDAATGINKAMRRIRGNDDDASGVNLARIIADSHCPSTFQREFYLDVRMCV